MFCWYLIQLREVFFKSTSSCMFVSTWCGLERCVSNARLLGAVLESRKDQVFCGFYLGASNQGFSTGSLLAWEGTDLLHPCLFCVESYDRRSSQNVVAGLLGTIHAEHPFLGDGMDLLKAPSWIPSRTSCWMKPNGGQNPILVNIQLKPSKWTMKGGCSYPSSAPHCPTLHQLQQLI